MKKIVYRGGIARFFIPDSWVEEYEPQGGAVFYEDKPNSGTLRINVMDAQKPSDDHQHAKTAREMIAEIYDANNPVEQLANGVVATRFAKPAIENGKKLLIFTWCLVVPIAAAHFRIIIFTYTILAVQESDPTERQRISMLERTISEGEYTA